MTRDEQRKACIEVMGAAYEKHEWNSGIVVSRKECMSAAFDALHGLAHVCPAETTNEMIQAGVTALVIALAEPHVYLAAISCWNAMSAAGDLTNPPEKKP